MARARLLKPGFFANETLAELPFEDRLAFAGLWTTADREGRLEDRPRRLAVAIFPYDRVDMDATLGRLNDRGFILRYECQGERYIQIVNFRKHQSPHVREPKSAIPAPGAPYASPMLALDESESGPAEAVTGDPETESVPEAETETETVVARARPNIFVLCEQSFGRGFSPMEAEEMRAMEEEYDASCIEHAFREAALNNKRSLSYVKAICRRHKADGNCYGDKPPSTRASPALPQRETAPSLRYSS